MLPDGQIGPAGHPSCQALLTKIFRFSEYPNHPICLPVPSRKRGVAQRQETWGGMRWTRMALLTKALEADGKACGPDTPTLVSSSRGETFTGDGGQKARRTGESAQ